MEWLIPLLIALVIVICIFGYLDMLDIVGEALGAAIVASVKAAVYVIVGAVKLAALLMRKFLAGSKPQP